MEAEVFGARVQEESCSGLHRVDGNLKKNLLSLYRWIFYAIHKYYFFVVFPKNPLLHIYLHKISPARGWGTTKTKETWGKKNT